MTPRTNAHRLVCWASISRHLGHSLLAAALLCSCGSDAPGESSSLEPCSVLSADEAGRLLMGPVKQEVPSPIKYKGISTGRNLYVLIPKGMNKSITVRTEATPTGAQRQRFEAGLRKAPGGEVSGIGDRAYIDGRPGVTFLRGETLATVTVEGLGIEEAKQVAAMVAPRLPASVIEPPPAPAASKGKREVGSGLGRFMDAETTQRPRCGESSNRTRRPVLHDAARRQQTAARKHRCGQRRAASDPERGGQTQEIKYKTLDKNEMEWTDQKGNVTLARRQFR